MDNDSLPRLLSFFALEHLDFQDELALSHTSRSTRAAFKKLLLDRLHVFLGRWFSDPHEWRQVMKYTNSVISGSSALWFLEKCPSHWSACDLDIYVPLNNVDPILAFLSKEGYENVTRTIRAGDGYSLDRMHLHSISQWKKDGRKIDVLESTSKSAVDPLKSFHSTLVMNFIAWNSMSVLYPSLTFRKIAIVQDATGQRGSWWRKKYSERGFDIRDHDRAFQDAYLVCPGLSRSVDDQNSLNIHFDTDKEGIVTHSQLYTPWKFQTANTKHALCKEVCLLGATVNQT
jgi:hypothetical protein